MKLWLQQVRNDAGSQDHSLPCVSVTLYRSHPTEERGRPVTRCVSPGNNALGQGGRLRASCSHSAGPQGCYTGLGLEGGRLRASSSHSAGPWGCYTGLGLSPGGSAPPQRRDKDVACRVNPVPSGPLAAGRVGACKHDAVAVVVKPAS